MTIVIAVTGGPCAGKTTVMSALKRDFEARGFKVVIVPEAATLLAQGGYPLAGDDNLATARLQNGLMRLQFALENTMSRNYSDKKMVILCDRGMMDNKAYMTQAMWHLVIDGLMLTEERMLARYDAVLHLQSAAVGAPMCYHTNDVRLETIEEAAALEARTLAAWENHPRRAVIYNDSHGFEGKVNQALRVK